MTQTAPATFQLPEQMSTFAPAVDKLYYFLFWLSVVVFVGIVAATLYWAWRYRERKGHRAAPTGHNMTLEIAWTVAPVVFLVFMFHKGFEGYVDLSVAPANAMVIRVNAKQWAWEFVYPNGASSDELHVPEHQPVKLVMGSSDVIHSLFIPVLRVKRDVVPGMFSSVWFEATHTGQADIVCAEYCGGRSTGPGGELPYAPSDDPQHPYVAGQATGHWAMHATLYVQTKEDFDKFLKSTGDPCDAYVNAGKTCPADIQADRGAKLAATKGCLACHTTTGARLVGPSWKGIWGKQEPTSSGPLTVDEKYVGRSIYQPNADIVTGYQGVMPTFSGQITPAELDELTAYIKSLKD